MGKLIFKKKVKTETFEFIRGNKKQEKLIVYKINI